MSMKVYDAFRIKSRGKPWELLWSLRDQALENVKVRSMAFYRLRLHDVLYTEDGFSGDPESWWDRLNFLHDVVRKGVKENAGSMNRDAYDVAVSITVAPYKGRYYLRAFCDHVSLLVGESLDFLESHPDLEDFHYQNSTDRPDNVTAQEWEHRKKVWDGIFGRPSRQPNQLTLNISDAGSWWMIDPYMGLAHELHQTPPVFEPLEQLAVKHLSEQSYFQAPVEASFESGRIYGEDFDISLKEDKWVATLGTETKEGMPLRSLVCWVKTQKLSPLEKQEMDAMVARWG